MRATISRTSTLLMLVVAGACAPEGVELANASDSGASETPVASMSARTEAPTERQPQLRRSESSAQVEQSRTTAIVRAAERVGPAVVSVNVLRAQRARSRSPWESFFLPPGAGRQSASFGSGVIVRSDGIILTNDHVITGAEQILVTLPGGREFDAELVGTDPVADIAVLRISGDDLPVAPVGTVDGLMIGEWALAIGNPLGNYAADAAPSVTAGVVSAVGRNIIPSAGDEGFYFGMIQTDASINPGNSGGPLVNAEGEVIGINASIISRSGGSEGLGFAIPIDRAMRIADDLVVFGEVRRAWVGLDVAPVEADAWGRTKGVRISRVAPGSPGDDAALQLGDRLLSANGRALTGPLDFEGVLLDLRAGDNLTIQLDGQPRAIELEAAAFPSVTAERVTVLSDIDLITVTPQIQSERGLASSDGALIADISDQLQGQLGLTVGDVIVQINRVRVRSAEQAAAAFSGLEGSGRIVMYFERNGGYNMRNFYWSR